MCFVGLPIRYADVYDLRRIKDAITLLYSESNAAQMVLADISTAMEFIEGVVLDGDESDVAVIIDDTYFVMGTIGRCWYSKSDTFNEQIVLKLKAVRETPKKPMTCVIKTLIAFVMDNYTVDGFVFGDAQRGIMNEVYESVGGKKFSSQFILLQGEGVK